MMAITKNDSLSMGARREKRERIGPTQGVFMIGVAGLFDFLQGILNIAIIGVILSSFVSIVAWLTFFLWFKLNGVSFFDSGARKLIVYYGGSFLELFPLLNTLPIWTITVSLMVAIVRAEDFAYNKKLNMSETA